MTHSSIPMRYWTKRSVQSSHSTFRRLTRASILGSPSALSALTRLPRPSGVHGYPACTHSGGRVNAVRTLMPSSRGLQLSSSSMMQFSLQSPPSSGTLIYSYKAWATANREVLVVGNGCFQRYLSSPYTIAPRPSSTRAWATGVNGAFPL